MTNRTINRTKLMQIANGLYSQGMTRSDALKEAWALLKGKEMNVSGVTFGKRQAALQRLTGYNPNKVSYRLERDYSNPYDRNAIAVVGSVTGKGNYTLGYAPVAIAKMLAPLMDRKIDMATNGRVIGGGVGFNYGLRLKLVG